MNFIDLFAGIGGIRIGFEKAGFKCVFSSEIDKYCRQTYRANFHEEPHGDITKIEAKNIPPFDILCAGFPCQPFSHAGLKKGFEDMRGTLFFEIIRIIEYHRPKVIFLENVSGLVFHAKGQTLKTIINALTNLNYVVTYRLLNAKDFGLPQNRKRIYITAFDKYELSRSFKEPEIPKTSTRIDSILESNVCIKYYFTQKQIDYHLARKKIQKEKGNGFGCNIFLPNDPYTATLSARYYKDGSEIIIKENDSFRKLTPRECARLQGFSDTFIIPVSDIQAYKQFGNSVAIPVIKALATSLKELFISNNKE